MVDVDAFLADLEHEFEWGVLLLQEFSSATKLFSFDSGTGHRVIVQPPCSGQRRSAIIVNKRYLHTMRGEAVVKGRHIAQDLEIAKFRCRFISAHLSASQVPDEYNNSIDDVDYLLLSKPAGYHTVIGVDGQDTLGYTGSECSLVEECTGVFLWCLFWSDVYALYYQVVYTYTHLLYPPFFNKSSTCNI